MAGKGIQQTHWCSDKFCCDLMQCHFLLKKKPKNKNIVLGLKLLPKQPSKLSYQMLIIWPNLQHIKHRQTSLACPESGSTDSFIQTAKLPSICIICHRVTMCQNFCTELCKKPLPAEGTMGDLCWCNTSWKKNTCNILTHKTNECDLLTRNQSNIRKQTWTLQLY